MYTEELEAQASSALAKVSLSRARPSAALVHSAMAGAYVGLAFVLVIVLGAPFAAERSAATGLVVASTFGIALSLVIFAGSDLFTGNCMVLPVGVFAKRIGWRDAARALAFSYFGNLAGSAIVALLAVGAGVVESDPGRAFVLAIAVRKMHLAFGAAFVRGILCNWLVVLAVWCNYRMKSESGRLIMVFWCLLGFVGSGYEHSVANMTVLTLANLLPHGPEVSWRLMIDNLVPVTLGNLVSGGILMGAAYWHVGSGERAAAHANVVGIASRRPPSQPPPPWRERLSSR